MKKRKPHSEETKKKISETKRKIQNLTEIRKCKRCQKEKIVTEFRKQGRLFRHQCKECYAASYRTGKPNLGRFQKGIKNPEHAFRMKKRYEEGKVKFKPFEKGQVPWNKGKFTSTKKVGRRINDWAKKVKTRDRYKCMKCNNVKRLHAHNIIPWKENELLRFDISNGITLCASCHAKLEGYQVGHK